MRMSCACGHGAHTEGTYTPESERQIYSTYIMYSLTSLRMALYYPVPGAGTVG